MIAKQRSMGRNYKEIMSAQKGGTCSSYSSTNMDWPTYAGGRPDECHGGRNIVHGRQTLDGGLDQTMLKISVESITYDSWILRQVFIPTE